MSTPTETMKLLNEALGGNQLKVDAALAAIGASAGGGGGGGPDLPASDIQPADPAAFTEARALYDVEQEAYVEGQAIDTLANRALSGTASDLTQSGADRPTAAVDGDLKVARFTADQYFDSGYFPIADEIGWAADEGYTLIALAKYDGVVRSSGEMFAIMSGSGFYGLGVSSRSGQFAVRSKSAYVEGPLHDDQWHVFIAELDPTGHTACRLYVDGALRLVTDTPFVGENARRLFVGALNGGVSGAGMDLNYLAIVPGVLRETDPDTLNAIARGLAARAGIAYADLPNDPNPPIFAMALSATGKNASIAGLLFLPWRFDVPEGGARVRIQGDIYVSGDNGGRVCLALSSDGGSSWDYLYPYDPMPAYVETASFIRLINSSYHIHSPIHAVLDLPAGTYELGVYHYSGTAVIPRTDSSTVQITFA